MKLRNFLYLNTKVVEDYIAAIDGYTYDEETQEVATSNENAATGKGALGVASGSGSHTGKQSEEIKRSLFPTKKPTNGWKTGRASVWVNETVTYLPVKPPKGAAYALPAHPHRSLVGRRPHP